MKLNETDSAAPRADDNTSSVASGDGSSGADLARLLDAAMMALVALSEPGEAGRHIKRIELYVRTLGRQLSATPAYAELWSDATVDLIARAALLHDIGNSAVPDRILLKPGALTDDELDVVRTHPACGREVIDQIARSAGVSTPFLDLARDIIYGHHERWDGKGYPQALVGERNPAPARLMAIADAYDALTSDRVYRSGFSHTKAVQLIFHERGGQFDPDMVDAFIGVQDEFADIAKHHADSEAELQRRIEYMAKAIAETP